MMISTAPSMYTNTNLDSAQSYTRKESHKRERTYYKVPTLFDRHPWQDPPRKNVKISWVTSTAFINLQCDFSNRFFHQALYFMAFMAFIAGAAGAAAFLAFFMAFMAFGMVKNGKVKLAKRLISQASTKEN